MRTKANKIAFLFSGGGAHYVGMANRVVSECPDLVKFNLLESCTNGPIEKLSEMEVSQPAIFVVNIAAHHAFKKKFGWFPSFMAGHSLGEYSALVCSGALSFEDGLSLVVKRGQILGEVGKQKNLFMAAVRGIDAVQLQAAIAKLNSTHGPIQLSVDNGPKNHVVSGPKPALDQLAQELYFDGVDFALLDINTASHTSYLESGIEEFRTLTQSINYEEETTPVVTNLLGRPLDAKDENRASVLTQHLLQPVLWNKSLRYMQEQGVSHFVELGSGTILTKLGRSTVQGAQFWATDSQDDTKIMQNLDAQLLSSPRAIIKECARVAVSTPNTLPASEEFEMTVKKPMIALKKLCIESREADVIISTKEAKQALQSLKEVLHGKGLSTTEVHAELELIIERTQAEELWVASDLTPIER
jgi:[acyl-carrier-protein] S-malonyltransferase